DPVLGDDLGAEQGRQADPQEPQSAGRPIGGGFVVPRRRAVERYHVGGATQGRTANGDQRHEPLHHVNGILLAARYVLLGRVEGQPSDGLVVFFSANVAIWARRLAFSASRTVSWLLVCSALSFHCSWLLVTSATRFLSRLIGVRSRRCH